MQTVLSHIVQKRLSQVNEDVATDALAFILESSDAARSGMIKLLRGLTPDVGDLDFCTQQADGSIRPDMWGLDTNGPRVFIENKFWAGLTDNQPISYLNRLAECEQPAILLVVAPEAREHTLWRELSRRLKSADVSTTKRVAPAGIVYATDTGLGPALALTSWAKLLSALELAIANEPGTKADLDQLRSLCRTADSDAFTPLSATQITDQRVPSLILQLGDILQAVTSLAVAEGVLDIKGLRPQASEARIGRYARFPGKPGVGVWIGTHFGLWRRYGESPLWLIFSTSSFGRAAEAGPLLEAWAAAADVFTAWRGGTFVVALGVETGEEKDRVVRAIVDQLRAMGAVLSSLDAQEAGHA